MIALNLPILNAADASPLNTQLPGSAQSIISSSSALPDFTAILTEMVGSASTIPFTAATATPFATATAIPFAAATAIPFAAATAIPFAAAIANPINSAPLLQNSAQLQNPLPSDNAQTPGQLMNQLPGNDAQTPRQLTNTSEPAATNTDALDAAAKLQQLLQQGQVNPQQAPPAPRKTQDPSQPNQTVIVPLVPVTVANSVVIEQKTGQDDPQQQPKPIDAATNPAAISPAISPQATIPTELQRAWADVKKFEFTVQNEPAKPGTTLVQAQATQADAQKEAIVTTDPIANIQLQQLPPRIVAIEKLVPDAKLPDKARAEIAKESTDTSATVPTSHFAAVTTGTDQVEQARPAQPVEIPQTPHVPVVRTVAMEVGDADSQVTVRIQERAGDISLQINAANEPLRQDLQSSVGSLVQTLKQEQVQVSNVDVSRKSPIEKVRRMKETNS